MSLGYAAFASFSPTTFADVLTREQVMDHGIRPLWDGTPRVAGPAYPVQLAPGDNLMMHAAIHAAPAGSVLVVDACDCEYAVAGGNVCAVAQRRGIAAFVIDGVIRDLAELRKLRFPVFARGVMPIAGAKKVYCAPGTPVRCGGVLVHAGDVVIADEEGIVVVPEARHDAVIQAAAARAARDAEVSLDEWEAAHRARTAELVRAALAAAE